MVGSIKADLNDLGCDRGVADDGRSGRDSCSALRRGFRSSIAGGVKNHRNAIDCPAGFNLRAEHNDSRSTLKRMDHPVDRRRHQVRQPSRLPLGVFDVVAQFTKTQSS
jgi:hypothetical protein